MNRIVVSRKSSDGPQPVARDRELQVAEIAPAAVARVDLEAVDRPGLVVVVVVETVVVEIVWPCSHAASCSVMTPTRVVCWRRMSGRVFAPILRRQTRTRMARLRQMNLVAGCRIGLARIVGGVKKGKLVDRAVVVVVVDSRPRLEAVEVVERLANRSPASCYRRNGCQRDCPAGSPTTITTQTARSACPNSPRQSGMKRHSASTTSST